MPFLAFPLRLRTEGTLRRVNEAHAMLSFLHVMAVTPGGTWRACPSFGIRDVLESGRRHAELCRVAMERANQAFTDLGITGYRVAEITREESGDSSLAIFSISLVEVRSSLMYSTRLSTDADAWQPRTHDQAPEMMR